MFGVIIAGRPVITEFQTIDATKVQFSIPATPAFSHIVVFILPGNVLPEGSAAAVYVQIPPSSEFRFLGAVANEKQSAIFKLNPSDRVNSEPSGDDVMIDDTSAASNLSTQNLGGSVITLGISLDAIATVETQVANLKLQKSQQTSNLEVVLHRPQLQSVSTKVLAQRIIKNAYNFLASFSGGNDTIPLKSFQDWWSKFEKKIELDPGFLEREQPS